MKKIYNADEDAKKSVKGICITTQTWPQDKGKRVTGILLATIPIVIYYIVWLLILLVPQFYSKSRVNLLNELAFAPVIFSSMGMIMLMLQYRSMQLLPKSVGDQLIFIDDGFIYRYLQGENLYTYTVHYKNINWMMYSSKRKHLVIDCQYTYSSEKKCDELYPQNIPSVPMVSDVMQKGTVVVPMCFGAVESILTVFLRTTGISINRDDHEWHK